MKMDSRDVAGGLLTKPDRGLLLPSKPHPQSLMKRGALAVKVEEGTCVDFTARSPDRLGTVFFEFMTPNVPLQLQGQETSALPS